MHLCENIYSHGYYNIDVFQFSLETVLEEESKEKEKEEKKEKMNQQGKEANNFLMKISKGKFGLYVTICFIMLTIIAIGSQLLM